MKYFPRYYYTSFLRVQFLLFFLFFFFSGEETFPPRPRPSFLSLSCQYRFSPPSGKAPAPLEKLAAPEVFIDSLPCEGEEEEAASGPLKRNSARGEERRGERLISVIEIRRAFANTSGGAVNARVIGSRAAKESRPVYVYIYIYIYIYIYVCMCVRVCVSQQHCVQVSIGRRNFSGTTHARRYIPRAYAYARILKRRSAE